VRLESDEDLVKVITIHASKGLEYPVVCLPFAHSHRMMEASKTPVLQLDDGEGERYWTLDFDKDDTKLADHDRLREDLRLWYVALTRARHALWVGWSPVTRGSGKSCVNHNSAAGHLLGGGDAIDEAGWLTKLQALEKNANRCARAVLVRAIGARERRRAAHGLAAARPHQRTARRAGLHRPHRQVVDDCELLAPDA
jgi:exodeoxyribonuclease V beta subunit